MRRGKVKHGAEFEAAVMQAVAEWKELAIKALQADDEEDEGDG